MAIKAPSKQSVEPIVETKPTVNESVDAALINLEEAIADQLLDDIDWSRVKTAMLTKVKQRFFAWLTSGNDTPVSLSPYPELSALPSSEDGETA